MRYNLGNAHFQQKQYGEAVDAYRQVLAERSGDEAARRNLELALRALRQKQQEQQQQQQQQQSKDGKKPQDPRQNDSKSPQNQEQKSKEPPQPKPGEEQKPGDQPKPGDENSQGAMGSEGKPPKGGSAEGKIGRKDAEKLLDSLAQEEKRDLRKRLARLPQEQGPEKDW